MDVFDFAAQMEKESEDFYERLASETANEGFKSIFVMLAGEEEKHYKIVECMRESTPQRISEADVLLRAKEIFERMSKTERKFDSGISQPEIYRKAQTIEKKSEDFYLKNAFEEKDAGRQEIFRKLAKEESKHSFLLKNIIDFVSRPETWLENAEWYHLEEY